ncbi:Ulp1 protease family, C-terminal catalytic domain [Cinara cedri]|uniref:Ulp1 protease family, C-terminal catalytic domain n=1 Tax=Cinara cedri TaxID=506608 RepID=A0A5E4MLA6_9HEMI|nr:Ulp1 protease family, C-terminal catalytic domain [Cinara cedri]
MSESSNQQNCLSLLSQTNTENKSPKSSTPDLSDNETISNEEDDLKDYSWYDSTFIEKYLDILIKYRNVYYVSTSFLHKYVATGVTGIRRWIKQDIFKKRYLFFPTHVNHNHWILIAVNLRKKQIYHYNSYGYYYERPVNAIVDFLKDWHIEKGKDPSVYEIVNCPTPAQKTSYDSGPWILQIAKCLTFGKPIDFSQSDMQIFRQIHKMEMDFKIIRSYSSKNLLNIKKTLTYIQKFGLKQNPAKESTKKIDKRSPNKKEMKNKKTKITKKPDTDTERSSHINTNVNDDTTSI